MQASGGAHKARFIARTPRGRLASMLMTDDEADTATLALHRS
jgi:hypothetical protein